MSGEQQEEHAMQEDEAPAELEFLETLLQDAHWARDSNRRLKCVARDLDMWSVREVDPEHEFTREEFGGFVSERWFGMAMCQSYWQDLVARFNQLDTTAVGAQRLKRNVLRRGIPSEGTKCDHAWRMAMKGESVDTLDSEEPPAGPPAGHGGRGHSGRGAGRGAGPPNNDDNLAMILDSITKQSETMKERMLERLEQVESREAQVVAVPKKEKPLALPEEELREYEAESYLPYCRKHGLELLDIKLRAYFRVPTTTELGRSSAGILRTGMYASLKETIALAIEFEEGGDPAWTPLIQQTILNLRNHQMDCDPNARAKPEDVYGEMFARIKPGDAFGQAAFKVAQRKKGQAVTKPRGQGVARQQLRCYNCGGEGHMARMCTKPKNVQPASQK
eukprot:gene21652-1232_t